MDFSTNMLLLLLCISMIAGFLDTLAGGGGLLTVPALMMTGIPPIVALGTNKLQSTAGTAMASYMMLKTGRVKWPSIKELSIAAFIGSAAGTILVQYIRADMLNFLVPMVLVVIATYFLLTPNTKENTNVQKTSYKTYRNFIIPGIGFYDGILGPGTGSFFNLSGVALRGLEVIQSTANAKILNFSTNIASLIVFLLLGKVLWLLGFVMILGQLSGAWLGSRTLLNINPKYLKYIIVIMSLSMLAKYVSTL